MLLSMLMLLMLKTTTTTALFSRNSSSRKNEDKQTNEKSHNWKTNEPKTKCNVYEITRRIIKVGSEKKVFFSVKKKSCSSHSDVLLKFEARVGKYRLSLSLSLFYARCVQKNTEGKNNSSTPSLKLTTLLSLFIQYLLPPLSLSFSPSLSLSLSIVPSIHLLEA